MKRDYRFFEMWARRNNMVPVGRFEEKEGFVLIADSGEPFTGLNDDNIYARWYRTAFCIERDSTWTAHWQFYPAADYDLMSRAEGQKRRVQECLTFARDTLHKFAETGLYDDSRKQSFSQRPH